MKVVVTGGAGFIGSHLVERLLKDKKIKSIVIIDYCKNGTRNIKHLLTNKRIKLIKLNIINLKKNNINFKSVDCVFHLAALIDMSSSLKEPSIYYKVNVVGTLNVLEAMRCHNVNKIVYAASASCYGITQKTSISETSKIQLNFPYAFTKYSGEQLIDHWSKVYGINYFSLRLFNVYQLKSTANSSYNSVISIFLRQFLLKKPLTIFGDGNQTRDFINVKDVCEAFIKAFKSSKKNKIINIGSSKPVKIIKIAKIISDQIIFLPRRIGETNNSRANILKAKKILNWKPKINFIYDIKKSFENMKDQK
jgi:UDP-glucose 4-epimerase